MEQWEIEKNKVLANEMQMQCGYKPNPACEKCCGFGRLHPLYPDGKVNYGKTIMCDALGCLDESFRSRSY